MINRENLIKIGRAGGNTSNRETPDQIGRVGMSANITIISVIKISSTSIKPSYFKRSPFISQLPIKFPEMISHQEIMSSEKMLFIEVGQ